MNRILVKPGSKADFETAFAEARPLLLGVPGCRTATLLRCVEMPARYIVQIGWDRIESHVEIYPQTEEAARVRALLLPLIAEAEPAHYQETDAPA